jgi:hypothetical protein
MNAEPLLAGADSNASQDFFIEESADGPRILFYTGDVRSWINGLNPDTNLAPFW